MKSIREVRPFRAIIRSGLVWDLGKDTLHSILSLKFVSRAG